MMKSSFADEICPVSELQMLKFSLLSAIERLLFHDLFHVGLKIEIESSFLMWYNWKLQKSY